MSFPYKLEYFYQQNGWYPFVSTSAVDVYQVNVNDQRMHINFLPAYPHINHQIVLLKVAI